MERTSREEGETKKLLATLAKLSLSNALQLRALRSILLEVHQVPTDNQEAMKATKAFAEARQGNVSQGQRRTASLTSMCGTLYWASQCEAWKIDRRPIRILRFSFRVR